MLVLSFFAGALAWEALGYHLFADGLGPLRKARGPSSLKEEDVWLSPQGCISGVHQGQRTHK